MDSHTRLTMPTLFVSFLLAAAPLAMGAPSFSAPAPVLCQDDLPDKRDEVKAMCEKFTGHIKKRGEEDREAIETVDAMLQEFENCGPKDRALVVKTLSAAFKQKRKEIEDGVYDNKLYMAAAVSLGEMAPESVKPLVSWIESKKHRRNLDLQRRLIRSLGKTKDPKAIKTLDDLLRHHEDSLVGAAAEALGQFSELELKDRKKIFQTMLSILMSAKGAVDTDTTNIRARERYDVIAAPIITSLQRLAGQDESSPEKWERWWNKNKKKDWDKVD